MYLDIGNNTLIDENEIIAVVNVSDKFFNDFDKNDLDYTKRGVYKSNISGNYLMNNFMKGI